MIASRAIYIHDKIGLPPNLVESIQELYPFKDKRSLPSRRNRAGQIIELPLKWIAPSNHVQIQMDGWHSSEPRGKRGFPDTVRAVDRNQYWQTIGSQLLKYLNEQVFRPRKG
jgi:hypothetical protein